MALHPTASGQCLRFVTFSLKATMPCDPRVGRGFRGSAPSRVVAGRRFVNLELVQLVVVGDFGGVVEVAPVFCSIGNSDVDSKLLGARLDLYAFSNDLLNGSVRFIGRENLNGGWLLFLGEGRVPSEKLNLHTNVQGRKRAEVFQDEINHPEVYSRATRQQLNLE